MSLPSGFTDDSTHALPLYVLDRARLAEWRAAQAPDWAAAVLGVGDRSDAYAHAPLALPADSNWRLAGSLSEEEQAALQLGWSLGSYRYTRYKQPTRLPARLLATPDAEVRALLEACVRVRDWVNTPAEDMGPEQLEAAARMIADTHGTHGTQCDSIVGEDLLIRNFPAIHAVGRAAHRG